MKMLIGKELQALFDPSVTEKLDLSFPERKRIYDALFHEPPANWIAPGAEAIGVVPLRAFAYLRNSEGIFEKSTSLLRQADPIVEWAGDKKVEILRFFSDPDTKGYAMIDRPGLMSCLIELRAGNADLLIVDEPSRVSRGGYLPVIHELLSQQRIPIVELMRGKAMTEIEVAFTSAMASMETKTLARRSAGGTKAVSKHRGKITKRLVWGYHRDYPGGPNICIDRGKAQTAHEIHAMFDDGSAINHIVHHLNRQWAAGIERYRPPGKAKVWGRNHLLGSKKWANGILRCRDYVGEFWHQKTYNWTDRNTQTHMQSFRAPEEQVLLEDPDLAIFKLEDRAMFERNQERLVKLGLEYQERIKSKGQPVRPDPLRYSSHGSGRRLLTGVVKCEACGHFRFNYRKEGERNVLKCGGTFRGSCHSHFRLDAEKVTSIILDKIEAEISDTGTLSLYACELRRLNEDAKQQLLSSKEEAETELARLGAELAEILVEMAPLKGLARNVYLMRRNTVQTEIEAIEKRLHWTKRLPLASKDTLRVADVNRCRTLLERLRDPSTYRSKDPNDLYVVETVRRMLDARLVPNDHDYGATLTVTIDFAKFFTRGPVEPTLKREFTVDVPPREIGFRSPALDKIDKALFQRAERHAMDDATWSDLEVLLLPHWNLRANRHFDKARHQYDAMFLSLRAGAGPCTVHNPHHDYSRLSLIHSNLRRLDLWPAVLGLLRKHGHDWVDGIDTAMRRHLDGEGGDPKAPWKVSETRSIDDAPAPEGATPDAQ